MLNALSFDLEEWYHPEEIRRSNLNYTRHSQAEAATLPILELLKRYAVRATFFTVGEVAAENPHLIAQVIDAGHELAFHGWTHKPLWALTAETFAKEIEQFLIWRDQHFGGVPVIGFRAPTFSLDATTAWALDVLGVYRFRYDSSIFPMGMGLYGVAGAPLSPYRIRSDDLTQPAKTGLLEIPMSVYPLGLGGLKLGFTGGFYLRALPWPIVKTLIQRSNATGRAANVYINPWEAHAATPRLRLSPKGRLILYYGLPSLGKLEKLLQHFAFDSLQNVFKEDLRLNHA